ncbi:MAG: sodium:solute symporter family protein [Cyclobacteriaceae bacterium]
MIKWMIIFGAIYLAILVSLAIISRRKVKNADDFMMGGFNIGYFLGFMTFAATLFSTFTLMGMPDFFRNHGVAAWIFLAVSDGAMVFMVLWFGYNLRKKAGQKNYKGMAGLLSECYGNKWAGYVYFIGIFLFLVPYVSIQIRGISIFLDAAFNHALPAWGWASLILLIMILYSETGGLKAIMYSDVFQGILLMGVVWVIAYNCVQNLDGIKQMFVEVKNTNEALLSAPGPKGLFTAQFLFTSMIAIVMIPVTQPQISSRLVIMKNQSSMNRMAVAVGCFAILVILPTVAIGMFGAVKYADMNTADFLSQVLLFDQLGIVAAATMIGLIAAAISTSDSQIFALSGELRSLLKGDEKKVLNTTKVCMIAFALAALVFSLVSSDQLVLLARVSFAGTALMAPMILTAILSNKQHGIHLVWITAVVILIFLGSLFGWVPNQLMGLRIDLILFLFLAVASTGFALAGRK